MADSADAEIQALQQARQAAKSKKPSRFDNYNDSLPVGNGDGMDVDDEDPEDRPQRLLDSCKLSLLRIRLEFALSAVTVTAPKHLLQ